MGIDRLNAAVHQGLINEQQARLTHPRAFDSGVLYSGAIHDIDTISLSEDVLRAAQKAVHEFLSTPVGSELNDREKIALQIGAFVGVVSKLEIL